MRDGYSLVLDDIHTCDECQTSPGHCPFHRHVLQGKGLASALFVELHGDDQ